MSVGECVKGKVCGCVCVGDCVYRDGVYVCACVREGVRRAVVCKRWCA